MQTSLSEDAYAALHKPYGLPISDAVQSRVSAELDNTNPLMSLPREAFIALLGLTVSCNVAVHGRTKTKTSIQMRQGLDVLRGTRDVSSFDLDDKALWTWAGMAALGMEPIVAFAYMRMVRELRALTTPLEA